MKKWFLNFVKTLKLKDFMYAVIILFSIGVFSTAISECSNKDAVYKNNIKALTDSINYYKAKDGNLVAMKTAFTAQAEELKLLNKDLYDKIKALDVKPKTITNTVYLKGETEFLPQDTVYVIHHDTISRGIYKEFNFNNDWRVLEGNVKYKNDTMGVNITKDIVKFDYTVAMDKNNKIYIKSTNPYVKYNEITGFQVPKPKTKRWGIGPQIGVGYDPVHNKVSPTIGIGMQWNMIQF